MKPFPGSAKYGAQQNNQIAKRRGIKSGKGREMTNIIDLSKAMKERKPGQYYGAGKAIFDRMPEHDQEAVFNFIREYSLCEVAISKGIVEAPMEVIENDELFLFADKVQEIYNEAAHGCYFCTDNDPNAVEFNDSSYLCLDCQVKVGKLLGYVDRKTGRKEA